MARIPRLLLRGESATYHVIARSALPGLPLGDVEKDFLLSLLRRLAGVYFAEVLGFCLMGSHAHVVVRMHTGEGVSDEEMRLRYLRSRSRESPPELLDGQIPSFRAKWGNLSEFAKEVKQTFPRWYNRTHGRAACTGPSRPPIPTHAGHPFRGMAATFWPIVGIGGRQVGRTGRHASESS